MALDTCYGIPADDFFKYADEIADVTKDKVQAVARQLIDFDKSVLAWVGP